MTHKEQIKLFENYKGCDTQSIIDIFEYNKLFLIRYVRKEFDRFSFFGEDILSDLLYSFIKRKNKEEKVDLNPPGKVVDYLRVSIQNMCIKLTNKEKKKEIAVDKFTDGVRNSNNQYKMLLQLPGTISKMIEITKLKGRPRKWLEVFVRDMDDEKIALEFQVKPELIRKWRFRALEKIRENDDKIINYLNNLDDENLTGD